MKKVSVRQRNTADRHAGIVALYRSGKYTTEQIAANYHVTPRQVQRIATHYGIIRSQADANRVAAPLKHYHTVPIEFRVKRKGLTAKKRYSVITDHPYCNTCGMTAKEGIRLEVDHIDENPANNNGNNLQVLCSACNKGKSQLFRSV